MSFAVIETGGKQYRVSSGSVISVEKLEGNEGDNITFDKVLLVQEDGDPIVGAPLIEGATVVAQVLAQRKGPKIRVVTYKPKKRQRRTLGHRQQLTQVKITTISTSATKAPKAAAPKKATAKTV
ncbi:MAG: 50S ribosomal protein L21 [bacterium]